MRDLQTDIIHLFHFDIVKGCQLRCIGCPNSTLLPKVERISVDDFDKCLSNVDVKTVNLLRLFNYGEPLLHHDLPGILKQIVVQRWATKVVELSTNAQFVNWDQFEEAIRMRVINRLVVSADGDSTPESYEALRPPSKWSKLMEFLQRATALRNKYAPRMELITRTIVDKASAFEGWNAILKPLEWEAEFRSWKLLPQSAKNMTDHELENPEGVCYFQSDPYSISIPWLERKNLYRKGYFQLYVDWSGTVVPCCAHPGAGKLGNLKDTTYHAILNGAERRAFVEQMESARRSMPVCGECEFGSVTAPGPSFFSNIPGDSWYDKNYRTLIRIKNIVKRNIKYPNNRINS